MCWVVLTVDRVEGTLLSAAGCHAVTQQLGLRRRCTSRSIRSSSALLRIRSVQGLASVARYAQNRDIGASERVPYPLGFVSRVTPVIVRIIA